MEVCRMDDRDYQFLLDLFETKNITRVAQKHFLSQPAMTKRIKNIEQELGCELVLRSKKGVIFTAAGESILPHCRAMVQQRHEMSSVLNRLQGVVGGSLNIYSSLNYGHYRLPAALKLYSCRYPLVDINIVTGKSKNIYHQLLKQEDCIAIMRGEMDWAGERILLSTEPMCLIYSHENAERPLASYNYISHHTDSSVLSDIERWASEQGLPLIGTKLWVDDINSCKEMAQCGIGWCILPKICLDDFDGEIHNLFFADGTPFLRNTYALLRESYARLQQVQLFVDILLENERAYHKVD